MSMTSSAAPVVLGSPVANGTTDEGRGLHGHFGKSSDASQALSSTSQEQIRTESATAHDADPHRQTADGSGGFTEGRAQVASSSSAPSHPQASPAADATYRFVKGNSSAAHQEEEKASKASNGKAATELDEKRLNEEKGTGPNDAKDTLKDEAVAKKSFLDRYLAPWAASGLRSRKTQKTMLRIAVVTLVQFVFLFDQKSAYLVWAFAAR